MPSCSGNASHSPGFSISARIDQYKQDATLLTSIISIAASLILAFIILLLIYSIARSFRQAISEAKRIGQGDWDKPIIINARNEIGHLMSALEHMRKELILRSEQEKNYNVVRNVLGDLAKTLQGDKDIQTLCDEIITFLANQLNAQVGALYLTSDNETLSFACGYGIGAQKQAAKTYQFGEGLVGQVASNQKLLLLDNLPANYLPVSSGVGSTTPSTLIIAPIIWNQNLMAIVEFGFISNPSIHAQRILEEGGEIIAVAIQAARSQQNIQRMLFEAKESQAALEKEKLAAEKAQQVLEEQTLKLQASEEELQAQSEELQAQSEELRVTNEELEAQTRLLLQRTKELEKKAASKT